MAELQKYSGGKKGAGSKPGQLSQGRFDQQLQKQFKYVADSSDISQCERESMRML